jgi:hypothetical protein
LIVTRWPFHPARPRAELVVDADDEERARVEAVLRRWHDTGAAISPMRGPHDRVVLRRRRTFEQIAVHIVAESAS